MATTNKKEIMMGIVAMFPKIPTSKIMETLESFNYNVELTIDKLLLESDNEDPFPPPSSSSSHSSHSTPIPSHSTSTSSHSQTPTSSTPSTSTTSTSSTHSSSSQHTTPTTSSTTSDPNYASYSQRKIQLFIQRIGKGTIPVEVPINGTIHDIKRAIRRAIGIPEEFQKLVNAGVALPSHRRISEYGFTNSTSIHLISSSLSASTLPDLDSVSSSYTSSSSSSAPVGSYQRPAYRELPMAKFPHYPLPGGEDFSNKDILIFCKGSEHVPYSFDSYGDAYPHFLQPGGVRPRCQRCKGEAIAFDSRALTWADICNISYPITGECFQCDSSTKIEFYYRCRGERLEHLGDQTLCGNKSLESLMISPLPGVIVNREIVPSQDTIIPDALQITFHPCGHRINANGLGQYLHTRNRHCLLRNTTAPEQLGHYVLKCFMDQCSGILPLPSTKLAGEDIYKKIKEWAVEEAVLSQGGVLCSQCLCAFEAPTTEFRHTCPQCEKVICEIHNTLYSLCPHSMTPDDSLVAQITEAFQNGRIQHCPNRCYADIGGQNFKCTHMTCDKCAETWCYFCGLVKQEYYCQNGCPWFLEQYHLTRGATMDIALRKFHRLKTLRLLRQLRAETEETSPGQFDRVFQSLPNDLRTVMLHPGAELLPEMELKLPHLFQPVSEGDFISGDEAQRVLYRRPLVDWP